MTDVLEALLAEPEAGEAAERFVLPGLDPGMSGLYTRGIRRRRSCPIVGFTGTSGHGKSASMVRDTLPTLAMGRPVLSTVGLLDPFTGNPHPLYVPFRSWSQLHDWRDGDILMDEVTGLMDSHDQGMPKHVRKLLPQMRRRNVMVRWSGIDWDNCNRRLRQMTQAVVVSRGHFPNHSLLRAGGERDAVPMWAPNRVFMLTTYDAQTLTQSDDSQQLTQAEGKTKKARVLNREVWRGPGSLAFRSYNTLDAVASVDASCAHIDQDTGEVCGGRIPEKVCKGHELGARVARAGGPRGR
jgi:hypothetical protein